MNENNSEKTEYQKNKTYYKINKTYRALFCVVLFSLFFISVASGEFYFDEETRNILFAKELDITHEISTHTIVNARLNWFDVTHTFYPKETFRQKINQETHSIQPREKTDDTITFRYQKPQGDAKISSIYHITTENKFKEIRSKVDFPIERETIPKEILPYTQETEFIDINNEIRTTAMLLASGKDDLFQVSQDIAAWVTENIAYDLSTLTAEATQKASWVIRNKYGVCDELSVLFIAMMRSLGVPARYVGGVSYTNSDLFDERWNAHAWAEVYFPEYGWVPFDLTYRQFGYVDASHISLLKTKDAGRILSSYEWEGFNLDANSVEIKETLFSQEITRFGERLVDPFLIDINPLYNRIGTNSFNVLKITLQNKKPYYVASTLSIGTPFEVQIESRQLPIYLGPLEEKTYFIITTLRPLQRGFTYTMPISVHTSFGSRSDTSFVVSEQYSSISIEQINAYLQRQTVDTRNTEFTIHCIPEKNVLLPKENSAVICSLKNNGNVFFENGEVCLDKECKKTTLHIGETKTLSFKISHNEPIEKMYVITAEFDEIKKETTTEIIVTDLPQMDISEILHSEIVPGKPFNISFILETTSIATPENIDLRVHIGKKTFSWDISSITERTTLLIPLHSYMLENGDNEIIFFASWQDSNKGNHFTEVSINLETEFSFFDKIKARWFKLFI